MVSFRNSGFTSPRFFCLFVFIFCSSSMSIPAFYPITDTCTLLFFFAQDLCVLYDSSSGVITTDKASMIFQLFLPGHLHSQNLSLLYPTGLLMVLSHLLGCLGRKALSFLSKPRSITPFLKQHGMASCQLYTDGGPALTELCSGHHGTCKPMSTNSSLE